MPEYKDDLDVEILPGSYVVTARFEDWEVVTKLYKVVRLNASSLRVAGVHPRGGIYETNLTRLDNILAVSGETAPESLRNYGPRILTDEEPFTLSQIDRGLWKDLNAKNVEPNLGCEQELTRMFTCL